jgi:hypothetical protein
MGFRIFAWVAISRATTSKKNIKEGKIYDWHESNSFKWLGFMAMVEMQQ